MEHLKKAVSCCVNFEEHTGEPLHGREIFEETLQKILVAMGAEQSEYGGIAVNSTEPTEKGRSGGLLQARKSDASFRSPTKFNNTPFQNANV